MKCKLTSKNTTNFIDLVQCKLMCTISIARFAHDEEDGDEGLVIGYRA